MEYLQSIRAQTAAFLGTVGFGFLLGAAYDLLRFVRLLTRSRRIAVWDVGFGAFAGAALFLFSLTCCGGKVRVHLLAAACVGFAVWYFFAGVPLRAASDGAVRALHRAAACVRRAFSRVEKYAERLRERLRPIPEKVKKSCKKNRKPS